MALLEGITTRSMHNQMQRRLWLRVYLELGLFLRKERAALLSMASHPLAALGTWLQLVTRHARRPITVKQLSCTHHRAAGIIRPTTGCHVSSARSQRQRFWRQRVTVARIRSKDGGLFPVHGVCFSAVLLPPMD